jgi:hypothetical protein
MGDNMELSGSQRKRTAFISLELLESPQFEARPVEKGRKSVPEAELMHVVPPEKEREKSPDEKSKSR